MGGLQKHDLAQFGCGRRSENRSLEPVFDQFGDAAVMVNVGVGQQKHLNAFGIKSPGLPVAGFHFFAALKHAAIHQDFFPLSIFHQERRTGHCTGCTETGYADHAILLLNKD
jgi:hypothetical protein